MPTNLITSDNAENLPVGQLALPFNEKQFADFLVSLLGKPQTINKRFWGSFCLDKEAIENIFQIIEQRIHQQNEAKLISFNGLISYNDNSTVELAGFDHLVNYNEPLPLVPKAIDMTWVYLMKFKDKDIPEKQEINISFNVGSGAVSMEDDYDYESRYFRNIVRIRIAHTARTWGADIEALLTKHILVLCKPPKGFKKYLYRFPETVKDIIRILLYIVSLTCAAIWMDLSKVSLILFLFLGTTIFAAIITLIVDNFEPAEDPSFILITKESYKDRDKTMEKHKRLWLKFLFTIFFSLIVSIIANYIYAYMVSK